MPTEDNDELCIAAVLPRENPSDAILIRKESYEKNNPPLFLKKGALIGTSSTRRKSQLLRIRPDLKIEELRGNVDTRLAKLADGHYDAIVMANAAILRLNLDIKNFVKILPGHEILTPSAAQGAIAIQCRRNDLKVYSLLQKINYEETKLCVDAERKLLKWFNGGCSLPFGINILKNEEKNGYQAASFLSIYDQVLLVNENSKDLKELITKVYKKYTPVFHPKVFTVISTKRYDEDIEEKLKNKNILINYEPAFFIIGTKPNRESNKGMRNYVATYDWIFFTSQNAVKYFFKLYKKEDLNKNVKFASIGKKTADTLARNNISCDFVPTTSNSAAFANEFINFIGASKTNILYPTTNSASPDLINALQKAGHNIEKIDVYTEIKNDDFMLNPKTDICFFTSSLGAKFVFDDFGYKPFFDETKTIISIGPATTKTIKEIFPQFKGRLVELKTQDFNEALTALEGL